jgi:hypothetical protein
MRYFALLLAFAPIAFPAASSPTTMPAVIPVPPAAQPAPHFDPVAAGRNRILAAMRWKGGEPDGHAEACPHTVTIAAA